MGVIQGGLTEDGSFFNGGKKVRDGFVATRLSVTSLNHTMVSSMAGAGVRACGLGALGSWTTANRVVVQHGAEMVKNALMAGLTPVSSYSLKVEYVMQCRWVLVLEVQQGGGAAQGGDGEECSNGGSNAGELLLFNCVLDTELGGTILFYFILLLRAYSFLFYFIYLLVGASQRVCVLETELGYTILVCSIIYVLFIIVFYLFAGRRFTETVCWTLS
jgi:hypothetical protein